MPIHIFFWKNVVLHVTIGKEYVVGASALKVMPNAFGVIYIARPVPVPVPLDNFVGGAACKRVALDWQ